MGDHWSLGTVALALVCAKKVKQQNWFGSQKRPEILEHSIVAQTVDGRNVRCCCNTPNCPSGGHTAMRMRCHKLTTLHNYKQQRKTVAVLQTERTNVHFCWKFGRNQFSVPTFDLYFKKPTRCTNYPNLFCYKTLHVSGIFSAHHQEISTVHSALLSFMQVCDNRFHAESILTLLGNGHQNLHETYQCRMYSRKLLMMGREDARNM